MYCDVTSGLCTYILCVPIDIFRITANSYRKVYMNATPVTVLAKYGHKSYTYTD